MYQVKTKWGNAKKQEYKGSLYDSKFECSYAFELDMRQKAGEITRWEKQIKIPLIVNGYQIANYFIDFVVYYPDGLVEYVETKGLASEVWKMKWKIFEALYSERPDTKLTVVYQGKSWRPNMRKIR